MFCNHCGKKIPDGTVVCTYCGEMVEKGTSKNTRNTKNAYAIGGFIFSFLGSIFGFIFSYMGYKKADEEFNGHGKKLAIAGMAISVISTIAWFLVFTLIP